MNNRIQSKKGRARQRTAKPSARKKRAEARSDRSEVLNEFGERTSEVVRQAASILEEEIAAGIVAARQVEKKLLKEDRFNANDFENVVQRFRNDAHSVVNMISDRVGEFRSGESDDLVQRFQKDGHEIVDTVMNLLNIAPEILTRLTRTEGTKKGGRKKKR